jgi:hypothetical protein
VGGLGRRSERGLTAVARFPGKPALNEMDHAVGMRETETERERERERKGLWLWVGGRRQRERETDRRTPAEIQNDCVQGTFVWLYLSKPWSPTHSLTHSLSL